MEVIQAPVPTGKIKQFWREYQCAVHNTRDRGFPFYGRSWHPIRSRWAIAKHCLYHNVFWDYWAEFGYRASDRLLTLLGYRQSASLPEFWWYQQSDFAVIRSEDKVAYRSRTTYFRRSEKEISGSARNVLHLLWITWRYARTTKTSLPFQLKEIHEQVPK
jgi:hypothetical protein